MLNDFKVCLKQKVQMTKVDLVHVQCGFNHLLKFGEVRDEVVKGRDECCVQEDLMFPC